MKKKISHLEAQRLRACRVEFSLRPKMIRALRSPVNAVLFCRLCRKHGAAMEKIATAERAIREHELAEYIVSFLTPPVTQAIS
jgi:hypothetical protein